MDDGKKLFSENVGGIDLLLRAFLGTAALIALAWGYSEAWQVKLALAALAFLGLFTGITRHCLPYTLVGFSTAGKR